MDDAAYFREHAERYRKLANAFSDHSISARLATLAEEFDSKARELPCRRARTIHPDPRLPHAHGGRPPVPPAGSRNG
jgi:hypothetical protein